MIEKLKCHYKDASLHRVRSVHYKRHFNKAAECHSERSDESLEYIAGYRCLRDASLRHLSGSFSACGPPAGRQGRQVHDSRRFNKVAQCHSERSDESLEWLMLDVISQTFTHFLRMYPTKF